MGEKCQTGAVYLFFIPIELCQCPLDSQTTEMRGAEG